MNSNKDYYKLYQKYKQKGLGKIKKPTLTKLGKSLVGYSVINKTKDVSKVQEKNKALTTALKKDKQEKKQPPKPVVEKKSVALKENKPLEKKAKATKKVKTVSETTKKSEPKTEPNNKQ